VNAAPVRHPGEDLAAVVFDLDGTLVDTAGDFIPAVQQLRGEYGLPPMDPARIRRSVSNGSHALVQLALDTRPQHTGYEQARQRLLSLYAQALGRDARLYPGLDALLAELEARAIPWGIATNKPRQYTEPLLRALALSPAQGALVCPEDVAAAKPHPESLQRICAALDCAPSRCIYIGDHARDIEAGRRAGLFTIAAAYGYIEEGDDADSWGADSLVEDSRALSPAIWGSASATTYPAPPGADTPNRSNHP
jgi:phosphoglycolate phosphatase